MAKLWVQRWEESERGWGTRPDGIYVYPTKELAQKDTERMLKAMRKNEQKGKPAGYVPDEYRRPCGQPEFIEVPKSIAKIVKEKGKWVNLFNWKLETK